MARYVYNSGLRIVVLRTQPVRRWTAFSGRITSKGLAALVSFGHGRDRQVALSDALLRLLSVPLGAC